MLYGKRVRLRLLESGDLRAIAEWRNKPEIADNFFSSWPIALSEQQYWHQKYLQTANDRMFIIEITIQVKDAKMWQPIGTLSLCNINYRNQVAELGRVMLGDKKHEKQGYMSEAIKLLLDFAFDAININRVYVETFEENRKAIALYEGCGFKKEGLMRQAVWKAGNHRNLYLMSILRKEYGRS